MKKTSVLIITIITLYFGLGTSMAQGVIIYPSQGQNSEQQSRDEYECYSWAKNQVGFDPMNPPVAMATVPAPTPQPQSGAGVIRGGARGALLGVTVGAITGDAGEGAAAGAAAGALAGGMRKRDQQTQSYQQPVHVDTSGLRDGYNRANAACLEGRGYSVK